MVNLPDKDTDQAPRTGFRACCVDDFDQEYCQTENFGRNWKGEKDEEIISDDVNEQNKLVK